MAETIVAHITFIGGSTTQFSGAIDNVDDRGYGGGSAYALRKADGTHCGNYATAGSAQRAFTKISGAGNLVRWAREDLRGDIEHYVGRTGR